MAATAALQGGQETFSRAQVAYLIHLAYEAGRLHGYSEEVAETVGTWMEHAEPRKTRADRIAERLADYERLSGPPRFHGGLPKPTTYFPADPNRPRPPFPTLAQQAAYTTGEAA